MTRCKHTNVIITEEYDAYYVHTITDDKHIDSNAGRFELTGKFHVRCLDCKYDKWFRTIKYAPKWIKQKFEQHIDNITL